ncbi:enoyl-CoA hydratase/isomerase family protein [Altererythrobacter marinus]|uniref:Enoyl-CoA hydratase/isomerase family protein n=1 Tax=Pelagerythrobacter marinus TaxID=538382 RepID=A0ABW9V0B9_9SPHN|nr:enoyl-CoA hydratase-related protein [Pelagerythrobacter marinus]MXO69480.1 enoyl-CoA hydratase/isomerase family protein [Pelagerythrobacter marinus]
MTAPLRHEREGAIARLLIDRADKKNAFNQEMWEAFPELLADAMADAAVRVLVLQSAAPGAFSAGADIAEFSTGARDPEWRAKNQAAIRRAQHELARADKPTIALIEGACVGGGCGLAIACDLRVATPSAKLGITPARLGLVYSLHDTKLLVDIVGPSQAKRILFTGNLVDGMEAARIGLVDVVSEDAAAQADAIASAVAEASPHSVVSSKRIVRRILDGQVEDDEETLAQFNGAFDGEDFDEGVEAFLAKRKARFRPR